MTLSALTPAQLFMLAFLAHFALVAWLYAWLTFERQMAVFKREIKVGAFANAGADPARSKRIARNLANQFELPVLFYAALALQLFFILRIAAMTWIDPQSTTFQRSEAWLIATRGRGTSAAPHKQET